LNQALDIPTSKFSNATVSVKGFQLSIPFHFIISKTIPSSDPHSPEHCLQLPPSIELGKVIIDNNSRRRYAQPSVSYELRAVVQYATEDDATRLPIECSLPFLLNCHTKEFPPTNTADFPEEFKLEASKFLRWSVFGRKIGTLTVTMSEPRPLTYNASSSDSSTDCHLRLEFNPTGSENVLQVLHALKFSIYPLIRVKTFYSVKSFAHLPSQSISVEGGKTGLRDELIKFKIQEVPHVTWSCNHNRESSGSITSPPSVADSTSTENDAVPGYEKEHSPQTSTGKWTASIAHPISVKGRLVPTFCCCVAARLYTIILRLKVSGIRRESFDLEVPLQVIHRASDGILDELTDKPDETGEHASISGVRGDSEMSRVSVEFPVGYMPCNTWLTLTLRRTVQVSLHIIIRNFVDQVELALNRESNPLLTICGGGNFSTGIGEHCHLTRTGLPSLWSRLNKDGSDP